MSYFRSGQMNVIKRSVAFPLACLDFARTSCDERGGGQPFEPSFNNARCTRFSHYHPVLGNVRGCIEYFLTMISPTRAAAANT